MSYIPMVKGVGADKWLGNGLRFATAEEALAYAADLQEQWMGCRGGAENRKAEESSDPVSHAWHNGPPSTSSRACRSEPPTKISRRPHNVQEH